MSSPVLIELQPADTIETASAKITLQPDVIFLLLGNFDASLAAQVRSVCARAVVPAALTANALLIDTVPGPIPESGSGQGIAVQIGQAAQQMDQPPSLLGILGPGAVAPDASHTHLVQLPAEWSDPLKSSLLLIAELTKRGAEDPRPVVVLLFGGNDTDKITVLRCARRSWPIMAVQGAGGFGDTLIAAAAPPADGALAPVITDPDLREIVDTGTICLLSLDGNVDDLKRVLLTPIQPPGDILENAWSRFDDLDIAANEKQTHFRLMQIWILGLGIAATLLAVAISGQALPAKFNAWLKPLTSLVPVRSVLHVLLVLVPITISILASFNSRFRQGNKWILLRAAAESIKREIFRYRTRAGIYNETQCSQASAPSKLAAKVKDITSNLMQSEVNKSSLPHRPGGDPARLKFLQPDEYVVERVKEQAQYFAGKTGKLYRQLKLLQIWILVVGGVGTFLAAINFEVWVAVTTALATAFTTKLEIDQVESSLVQYNIALTSMRNIESWWKALSPWEKTRRKNIDLLVEQAETTLARETAGWVQQMQSELDKLTEKQTPAGQTSGSSSRR
jgi:hypothetical protein